MQPPLERVAEDRFNGLERGKAFPSYILDNIVIVDSDDALLVADKGKIQTVKKVAEEIKKREG